MKTAYITITGDPDPDFDWLDQSHYDPASSDFAQVYNGETGEPYDPDWYRNPENHVLLQMTSYDKQGEIVTIISHIDFLADGDNWNVGTFTRSSPIRRLSVSARTGC